MLLPYFGELPGWEATGEPHQCRPKAAMDQNNFAVDETTNENVFRGSHRLKRREDFQAANKMC
jgi:hypothetical protein